MLSTFVREQTATLPRGRFMVSMVQVNTSIDRSYDWAGNKSALSDNFGQSVDFQRIVNEEPARGAQLSGLFAANGLSLQDSAASVSGTLSGTVDAKVPVIGYGLTDHVGLYLTIPIIQFRIQSTYQVQTSAQTQSFLESLVAQDQKSVAREFEMAMQTSLENKLHRSGLTWDPNLNRTYLGDLQLMVMRVWTPSELSPGRSVTLQALAVLPTATGQDMTDLYGLRAGERRWGLGVRSGFQQDLGGRWMWNSGASATALMPTVRAKRFALNPSEALRDGLDPTAEVSGGARFQAQTQLRYQFPRWLGLNLGLQWQQRLQESYTGSAFSADVYARGSRESGEQLWSSYASLDLNSIQSFLDGDFMLPAVAELGVGIPFSGRNAIAEPVIQLQGSLFF